MKLSDLGIGHGSRPVAEYQATGEIERVYHELKQSLRVTGVNLVFRTWAAYGRFLPAVWDELRPNIESSQFDRAADEVREQAMQASASLLPHDHNISEDFGPSRAYQIRAALDLYRFINPKLLVLVSAVRQVLQGESTVNPAAAKTDRAPRGEPVKMYPMEMEVEQPDDLVLRRLFKDIRKTLSLPSINSDYRTLALWPDYLEKAWELLKPVCTSPAFKEAASQLCDRARSLANQLPYPLSLSLGRVKELGQDSEQLLQVTRSFEELLPGLILNLAILQRNWEKTHAPEPMPDASSSSPSEVITDSSWRSFQKRQHVMELGDHYLSYIDEGEGEPVVLLHGIPTWGYLWEKTISALNPCCRVLVPDLLGYGYSDKRDNFDRSIALQAELLDEWLSRLNLGSVHVVGHDLGGGIALRLATLYRQRVRSLCLMNSACYDAWPVEMMLQLGHPGAAKGFSPEKTLKLLRNGLLLGFEQAPSSIWLVEGLLSPWRTEVGRLSLVRNAAALNTNHTTEISHLLPTIQVPALVLWGEDDSFLPVSYGERLARDIPGASLVRMSQARHFVMIDQPERVHRAILDFVQPRGERQTGVAA